MPVRILDTVRSTSTETAAAMLRGSFSVECVRHIQKKYAVTIAGRSHLFPYRTQKLSSFALMILGGRPPGKAGRCRLFWSYGQAVKTPPFHGGNPGSIPGRITKEKRSALVLRFSLVNTDRGNRTRKGRSVKQNCPVDCSVATWASRP